MIIRSIKRLAILFFLLMLFSACSNLPQTDKFPVKHPAATEEDRISYLQGKGYNVIESKGITDSYILERNMLLDMHYGVIWGLQNVDVNQYIGNEIKVFSYIINNHPVDKMSDLKQTKIWLLTCENMIVGGYTVPHCSIEILGIGLSIDGQTLEEVTGLSYHKWRKKWMAEYQ